MIEALAPVAHAVDSSSYRTFLSVESEGSIITAAQEQLSVWLREAPRRLDVPLQESGVHREGDRELIVLHNESAEGRSFRARLSELNELGEWRTQLTVNEPRFGDPGWLALRVSNSDGRFVDVPRLAGYLLDSLLARDGSTELSPSPRLVPDSGVDDLMEELCDPDRQGLFFVAGSDERRSVEAFSNRVESWTKQVRGLGQVVVLSPSATVLFNDAFGTSHSAPPWAIRTFQPDVDPAITADGRRHRVLSAHRLGDQPVAASRSLLGKIARRHAAERTPPVGFAKVDRAFVRIEDGLLVGSLIEADSISKPHAPTALPDVPLQSEVVADGAELFLAQIELVKATLGIEEITKENLEEVARQVARDHASAESVDRITRQLNERQLRVDSLQTELGYYKELYDEEQLDSAVAVDARDRLADENRWLRLRLAEHHDTDGAYGSIPDEELTVYPDSFDELLERVSELEDRGVVVTADRATVLGLDEYDTLGKIVRNAWDGLLVLADYVKARGVGDIDKGIAYYLEHASNEYRKLPPKKYAEKETGATMKGWGSERLFVVPTKCDPGGHALMEGHFKLGRVGMVSPRMHFLDSWSKTGEVYVGYIGAHLTNTQTN